MRRLSAVSICIALSACSPSRRPVVTPQVSPTARLAAVDAELRAGCLDCLIAAYRGYDELRREPSIAEAATAGAIRAAALIALRQRELGMVDEGYLAIARDLAAAVTVPSLLRNILDVVDALPRNSAGIARTPTTDLDLERLRRIRTNSQAWLALLRDGARSDLAAAYTLLSFACDSIDTRNIPREELFSNVDAFAGAPLIVYRESLCRSIETATIEPLLTKDPRFAEITYSLGLANLGARPRPKLDEAEQFFQQAYTSHPRWPSLTLAIAGVAMTAEDFDRARAMYAETLTFEPHSVDAELGMVRALTYLARYEDAIAAASQLIDERWYVGDALYWRAFNELQLSRLDEAWRDVEDAEKVLINAGVPKLAGLIAYRREQLDVAIARFSTSRERGPFDCETRFYLGVVHAELRHWPQTADILTSAATCLQNAEDDLKANIERIRVSNLREDRKARQIAKREQEIAEGRRRIATSWFDTAVAFFSLSKKDEARQYAERVADDEQFGQRARDILARLR
jgi:tetratricopeptide (TPR) repeat protein